MSSSFIQALVRATRRKCKFNVVEWSPLFLARLNAHERAILPQLPSYYQLYLFENLTKQPTPVHYIPDENQFRVNDYGVRYRVQNIPYDWHVIYPPLADEGLWGGEGVVRGYRYANRTRMLTVKVWNPVLQEQLFYSEILDRRMQITVTRRTLELVDECAGFDNYILQTHEVDLKSKLGMTLKREMLLRLSEENFLSDNPEKRAFFYSKYKKYIIPKEEIHWIGLTLPEAVEKFVELEAEVPVATAKQEYARDLLSELDGKHEAKTSWLTSFR